jgi:hypothetical protein
MDFGIHVEGDVVAGVMPRKLLFAGPIPIAWVENYASLLLEFSKCGLPWSLLTTLGTVVFNPTSWESPNVIVIDTHEYPQDSMYGYYARNYGVFLFTRGFWQKLAYGDPFSNHLN